MTSRQRVPAMAAAGVLWAACGLFTAVVTAPLLPDDFAIYLDALHRAVAGADPYHPFGIGASFVYPPTALLALLPLSWLSAAPARFAWTVAGIVCGLLSLALLIGHARDTGTRPSDGPPAAAATHSAVVAAVAALLYAPFLETLVVGQINLLVLLGIVLFVARGRIVPRALGEAGLALAIAVKVTPALLLVSALARGQWRTPVRVAVLVAILSVAAASWFGTSVFAGWMAIAPQVARGDWSGSNHSLAALLHRLVTGSGGSTVVADRLALVPVAMLVLWWTIASWRLREADASSVEAFGLCLVTAASSLVWYHHLVWLWPVALITWLAGSRDGSGLAAMVLGLSLVQSDRLWEVTLAAPPVASAVGSLLVAWSAWRVLAAQSSTAPVHG